jgi:hypothetical protein
LRGLERWAGSYGGLDVVGEAVFDGVAAERSAGSGREQRVDRIASCSLEPSREDGGGGGDERG